MIRLALFALACDPAPKDRRHGPSVPEPGDHVPVDGAVEGTTNDAVRALWAADVDSDGVVELVLLHGTALVAASVEAPELVTELGTIGWDWHVALGAVRAQGPELVRITSREDDQTGSIYVGPLTVPEKAFLVLSTPAQAHILLAGDLIGDATDDVAVSWDGLSYGGGQGLAVYPGPLDEDTLERDPGATLLGELSSDAFDEGTVVGPDLTGDGKPELLVLASGSGDVGPRGFAVSDPNGVLWLGDAELRWSFDREPDLLSGAGDVDGDGLGDLLVVRGGVVRVDTDPMVLLDEGTVSAKNGDLSVAGAAGDLDGDGHDDLLVADQDNVGGVWLMFGPIRGSHLAEEDAVVVDRPKLGVAGAFVLGGELGGDRGDEVAWIMAPEEGNENLLVAFLLGW